MLDLISRHAGMIGLLFFFGFFTVMGVWVFRPGAKQSFDMNARIPLMEKNDE